jgi:hypothetical protein
MISQYKIHLEEQLLVAETKQCRHSRLPCWPDCLVGPTALLAQLPCFVPATIACSSKWIFVAATNSTNKAKQGRWYVPIISLFNNVYGSYAYEQAIEQHILDTNAGKQLS